MHQCYVVTLDPKSIQNRNAKVFPQNATLYGLIEIFPGRYAFRNQGLSSHFDLICCSSSRAFAAMFHVDITKSWLCKPNSKLPFHTSALSVHTLEELIDLFSLHGGTVMGPCAGSMTVVIVALKTGRKCLYVEKDEDYFNTAPDRLWKCLPPTRREKM